MNPLETAQPFSLTLANPNPKFRTRKGGDKHTIEFEVSAEEWEYFTDPNIDRTGMVIEAVHCEVTHQHVPEKPKVEDKVKGGPLAELAGMWSKDPQFWRWADIYSDGQDFTVMEVESEQQAREFILRACGIQSRRELDHDGRAKRLFEESIRKPFANYLARLGR